MDEILIGHEGAKGGGYGEEPGFNGPSVLDEHPMALGKLPVTIHKRL